MATRPPDLPRVTRVLAEAGLGPDLTWVTPAALEATRDRGNGVHSLLEAHGYGALEPGDVEPKFKGYVDACGAFCRDLKHEPIASEVEVVSRIWSFLGHLDRIGWVMKGLRAVIDWKTGDLDEAYVTAQLGAYSMAWNEMYPAEPVSAGLAVQLKSDGTYRVFEADLAHGRMVFQACLVLYAERRGR